MPGKSGTMPYESNIYSELFDLVRIVLRSRVTIQKLDSQAFEWSFYALKLGPVFEWSAILFSPFKKPDQSSF